jgi:putative transposase
LYDDIRKVIYNTNAAESLNMSLRKVIKAHGSCPDQEGAMKLLCLILHGHDPLLHDVLVQNCKALQCFANLLGERVPKAELT